MCDSDAILKKAGELLERQTPLLPRQELAAFVGSFLQRRDVFLRACAEHGSPLYLIEEEVLLDRAREFTAAFRRELPDVCVYYALKSNNNPAVIETLAGAGLGLDVSSGCELQLALQWGAASIIFTGPGKTDEELGLAVENRDRVTVLMDSFGELERLERVAAGAGARVHAGVRLTTQEHGLWRKFGIRLSHLSRFAAAAQKCPHVQLCGLHFHTSWNRTPSNHVRFIRRLGSALHKMPQDWLSTIEFIDIGGGFWPSRGEWLQPGGTPEGQVRLAVGSAPKAALRHHKLPAVPIEEFADKIAQALRAHVFPCVRCRVYTEPGRWICNDAMHLIFTIVDKKEKDLVITDAGINAIGWDRFETDYFPVINLSRPDVNEHECYIMGSLCTPHDIWGYAYYGADIQLGDVLMIPTQGAYTYSLRQNFIKPVPQIAMLKADRWFRL